ncbi:unnamed protein product [Rotaria sp. Silwood2]|nr:unnamed protein product [Rotaria sp. Silwood2]
MVLSPRTGLGRLLLFVIILSTISYLVLNLVSFGGTPWITYTNVSITFGLWRVCYTGESGVCNQWTDNTYDSSFIKSSQPLEIISLIFYVFAAFLIMFGIINLGGSSFQIMFLAAAILLFICIVFISATLGVMSVQGRSDYSGFLDWAWWNGLVGLIMTIVFFFSLFAIILDMRLSPLNRETLKKKKNLKHQQPVYAPYVPPMSSAVLLPPVNSQLFYSPAQIPTNVLSSQPMHFPYDQGYLNQHFPTDYFNSPEYNSNNYFPHNSMQYQGQYPFESYNYNQTLPPMISQGALDYALYGSDAQFQQDHIHPYYTNTYL